MVDTFCYLGLSCLGAWLECEAQGRGYQMTLQVRFGLGEVEFCGIESCLSGLVVLEGNVFMFQWGEGLGRRDEGLMEARLTNTWSGV